MFLIAQVVMFITKLLLRQLSTHRITNDKNEGITKAYIAI